MWGDFFDEVTPEGKVTKTKEEFYDEWVAGLEGKEFGDRLSIKLLRPHLAFHVGMVVDDVDKGSRVLVWPAEEDELDFEAGRIEGHVGMVQLVGRYYEMLEKDGRDEGGFVRRIATSKVRPKPAQNDGEH